MYKYTHTHSHPHLPLDAAYPQQTSAWQARTQNQTRTGRKARTQNQTRTGRKARTQIWTTTGCHRHPTQHTQTTTRIPHVMNLLRHLIQYRQTIRHRQRMTRILQQLLNLLQHPINLRLMSRLKAYRKTWPKLSGTSCLSSTRKNRMRKGILMVPAQVQCTHLHMQTCTVQMQTVMETGCAGRVSLQRHSHVHKHHANNHKGTESSMKGMFTRAQMCTHTQHIK